MTLCEEQKRALLKDKKRIIIKVGSASLVHAETGGLNLRKIEGLCRAIADLKGEGRDVILVSSGAIACGRQSLGIGRKPHSMAEKQAFAAVGQARLMTTYQQLFSLYNLMTAQVLLTKGVMINDESRRNTANTFSELLALGVVPVVNENDTISTHEIKQVETFGDNDQLAAIVGAITKADLVILLSDIDGMFTDDPRKNPDARLVTFVPEITDDILKMGKSETGSDVGTGGMSAKITAARIAVSSGADLVITKFADAGILYDITEGKSVGTLFAEGADPGFDLMAYLKGVGTPEN